MNLTIAQIARLSEDEASDYLHSLKWPTGAVCPKCSADEPYFIKRGCRYRCRKCKNEFSLLSGTVFSDSKLPKRDLMLFVALFAKNAKGISAHQCQTYFGHQYKTVFVMAHKLRECMWKEQQKLTLRGTVEIDGAYFGGYMWRPNTPRSPGGRRHYSWHGTRKVVVVARQRGGRTVTVVVKKESEALFYLNRFIEKGSTVHADGAHAWDQMKELHKLLRINHALAFSADGVCTNWAESFFSRMRRSAMGVYGRIAGDYLAQYAAECAWREDNRKNASAWIDLLKLAMEPCHESKWKKYWQKKPMRKTELPKKVVQEIQSVATGTFG